MDNKKKKNFFNYLYMYNPYVKNEECFLLCCFCAFRYLYNFN